MPHAPAAFPTKLLLTLESVGGRYQHLHEECVKHERSQHGYGSLQFLG